MPVKIRCPNPDCGKAGSVADDRAGQSVRCPQCKTIFSATPAGEPVRAAAKTMVAWKNAVPTLVPGETAEGDSGSGAAPPMPATIGRFVVRAFLGAGACGSVYRAFDPDLEREVALKVPHADRLNPIRLQRFLIEAKATAKLRHTHIVPVYETGVDREHHFIVSAFIDGRTLAEVVADGPLDFRQAAGIVRDLAEALAHAHANGIVHRDVKPGNVMLDAKGQAYLTDFGLAQQQDAARMTRLGSFLGTPAYMAPETAKGTTGDCKPACDQYSLGAVLYELLCGQPPYSGPPEIVLFNVVNTPLPLPSEVNPKVPAALAAICVKALAKQPSERFADCGQLAEALRLWLAEQKTTEDVTEFELQSPRPSKPVTEAWWRSKPFLVGFGGTTALMGLIGVLALVLGGAGNSGKKNDESAVQNANEKGAAGKAEQRIKMLQEELNRVALQRLEEKDAAFKADQRTKMLEKEREELIRALKKSEQKRLELEQIAPLKAVEDPAPGPSAPKGSLTFKAGPVGILCFSPDGQRLATACNDRDKKRYTVDVWNAKNGDHLLTLKGHSDAVMSVCFSPNGQRLASASCDKTAKLWNAKTGEELLTFRNKINDDWFYGVSFSPDGTRLATQRWNSTEVWDVDSGANLLAREVRGMIVQFSPDGQRLAVGADVAGKAEVKVLDAISGANILTLNANVGFFNVSSDGNRIVAARKNQVIVWGAMSGRELLIHDVDDKEKIHCFSVEGHQLASSVATEEGKTGEPHALKVRKIGAAAPLLTLKGHSGPVKCACFSPDGQRLAFSERQGRMT